MTGNCWPDDHHSTFCICAGLGGGLPRGGGWLGYAMVMVPLEREGEGLLQAGLTVSTVTAGLEDAAGMAQHTHEPKCKYFVDCILVVLTCCFIYHYCVFIYI